VRVENIKAEFSDKADAAQQDMTRALQELDTTEATLKAEEGFLDQRLVAASFVAKQVVDEHDWLRRHMQALQQRNRHGHAQRAVTLTLRNRDADTRQWSISSCLVEEGFPDTSGYRGQFK